MNNRERLIRLMQEASRSKSDYAGNIGLPLLSVSRKRSNKNN